MKSGLTFVLLTAVAAGVALAQAPPSQAVILPTEVTGTVVEAGLDRGIPDAEVTIRYRAPQGGVASNQDNDTIHTDDQGQFRFRASAFGEYTLTIRKEGYVSPVSAFGTTGISTPIFVSAVVDAAHPRPVVQASLLREAELTGRLIDADGQPLAGVRVNAQQAFSIGAIARAFPGGAIAGLTDAEGKFAMKRLAPGRYLIAVEPRVARMARFLTEFTKEDSEIVDEDFPASYWPGTGDLQSVQPVSLKQGESIDAGTFRLRTARLYRVQVAVAKSNCEPGSPVDLLIRTVDHGTPQTSGWPKAICGQDFLLRNFEPGEYTLLLEQQSGPDRVRAILPIEIRDRNLHLAATLARGADVEGQILAAKGAGPIPLEELQFSLTALDAVTHPGDLNRISSDARGHFQIQNYSLAGKLRINLLPAGLVGSDPAHYIKEIRYNASVLPGNTITWNPASPVQTIEIEVDDRPASIDGTVKDRDRDVEQPYVVLVKGSPPFLATQIEPKPTPGGANGSFHYGNLPPGEYRIFAVAKAMREKLDEPGAMLRAAERGEKLTVEHGSSQVITLKLTDPTR